MNKSIKQIDSLLARVLGIISKLSPSLRQRYAVTAAAIELQLEERAFDDATDLTAKIDRLRPAGQ